MSGFKFYFFGFLFLALSLSTIRCGSNVDPLFIMQLEARFVIQPGLNSFDTHYFTLTQVPTRIKNYLGQGVDVSEIDRILPNRAELNAQFNNIDWGIVREIQVLAVSVKDPSIKKEIFYHDRVNLDNVNELRLLSSLSEVKDILLQELFHLEIRLNFRRPTPVEIDSRLTMNFVVNGKE